MGPRQEELLSYFQGLAPVGEMFEVPCAWIAADLGFNTRTAICNRIADLISQGMVRRIAVGACASTGLLMVIRRLEDMPRHLPPVPPPPAEPVLHPRASKLDWSARLAEIPRDTRTLTARIFGDPIPNDPRRHA